MNVETSSRDFGEHVLALVMGVALWIVESYSATSALVFSPEWTVVGAVAGVALLAFLSVSETGVAFKRGLRESRLLFLAVTAVGFFLVIWATLEADATVRPAHYSGFLGFGLSQLLGIALYLRERASG